MIRCPLCWLGAGSREMLEGLSGTLGALVAAAFTFTMGGPGESGAKPCLPPAAAAAAAAPEEEEEEASSESRDGGLTGASSTGRAGVSVASTPGLPPDISV